MQLDADWTAVVINWNREGQGGQIKVLFMLGALILTISKERH